MLRNGFGEADLVTLLSGRLDPETQQTVKLISQIATEESQDTGSSDFQLADLNPWLRSYLWVKHNKFAAYLIAGGAIAGLLTLVFALGRRSKR